jgi:hypothetical protein
MAREQLFVWIDREDFDRFREILGDDPDFPDTFDDFAKSFDEHLAKAKSNGFITKKVVAHPNEFVAYCTAAGLDYNTVTLYAFAIYKDTKSG